MSKAEKLAQSAVDYDVKQQIALTHHMGEQLQQAGIKRKLRAIIYCRVSTDRQEQDGESLEYQEAKCRQYAELHNIDVLVVLKETKSGYIHYSLREKLTLARQYVRDRLADIIIVWDLRRFSRNFVHSAMIFDEIESSGGSIISVSENIDNSLTGKLIRSILAWSAESEREKILEYANRRAQTRMEQNLPVGTGIAPYGWDWGNSEKTFYILNREEAAIRFAIFHMFVEFDMSLRAISQKLTEDGVFPPRQAHKLGRVQRNDMEEEEMRAWGPATILGFLHDRATIGVLTIGRLKKVTTLEGTVRVPNADKKEIPGGIPRIVSNELFARAQAKLATNREEKSHQPTDPQLYLVKGYVYCAHCEWKMAPRTHYWASVDTPYYYCNNRKNAFSQCGGGTFVRADLVDQLVWDECCHLFDRLEVLQARMEQEITKAIANLLEDTTGREKIMAMQAEIAFIENERSKHEEGSYYYNLTTQHLEAQREKLARYEQEMGRSYNLVEANALYQQRVLSFLNFLNVMRGNYHQATFQQKRNALDVLGVQVLVYPKQEDEEESELPNEEYDRWEGCAPWISIREVCQRSGFSDTGIRRYIDQKKIHALEPETTKGILVNRDSAKSFLGTVSIKPPMTLSSVRKRIQVTYSPVFIGEDEHPPHDGTGVRTSPQIWSQHGCNHRPIAAARLSGNPPVFPLRQRPIMRIDPGDDLIAEITMIATSGW